MVRILQFGATGQLGREMVARGGEAVRALSRVEADLTDAAALEAAIAATDAQLVVIAAAYTAVDQAECEEAAAFAVNAEGPGVIARACAARALPLVFISTDYVFDGEQAGTWTEEHPTSPINAYGRSKLAGERAVVEAGGQALILRTSWLFSPYGRNFVKTMLAAAATRPDLRIVDDQRGRPTAAGDLANFILATAPRLVAAEPGLFGVFHFAGEGAVTWREFAEAIFAGARPVPRVTRVNAAKTHAGPASHVTRVNTAEARAASAAHITHVNVTPVSSAEFPTPARRPRNSVLDCGKLERAYGVRPRPWREGLSETLAILKTEASA